MESDRVRQVGRREAKVITNTQTHKQTHIQTETTALHIKIT